MGRYTEDEIQIAKSVDLVDLAESVNLPVKKKGNYYQLKDMSSAMIFNRTSWYRYSESVGGSTIDFLMYFKDMEYKEAVSYLLDFAGYRKLDTAKQWEKHKEFIARAKNRETKKEKKPFVLPEKSQSCRRLYAYLMKKRKLSKQVIQFWLKNNLLYESEKFHNLVFLGKDTQGKVRFASQRGTVDTYGKAFKSDVEGNDKTYGVNLVSESSGVLNVYEAAIDAMSDMDFRKDYDANILALGMVSDGPLHKLLENYAHIHTLNLCLDNDEPGRKAAKKIGRKYVLEGYEVYIRLPPFGKDYNAFLQCERENRELYMQINRAREKKIKREHPEEVSAGVRLFYPEGLKGKKRQTYVGQSARRNLQMAMTR